MINEETYQEALQKVQTKKSSLALINHEENREELESNTKFNSSLQKNLVLMAEEIDNL